MKKLLDIFILSALFIFPTQILAQTIKLQTIDSLTNKPIENVYLFDDNHEFISVSDNNGICSIVLEDTISITKKMNINIAHIGYYNKTMEISSIPLNNPVKLFLSPKIYELNEVVISPPNANSIIKTAIENINNNYCTLIGDTLDLKVNFIFLDNPGSKVADFDGNIGITDDGKNLFATKYLIKKDSINDSFYNYGVEISPSGFYSIIFIKSHSVIRKSKKYKFYYNGIVEYQGEDAYKISFERNNKYIKSSGYMLINIDDYAIVNITNNIGECKKWIASTQKGMGLIYTNLKHYQVSASYFKNNGKYKFSDGSINMLFNRTKKKKVISNNTYNVNVKRGDKNNVLHNINYVKVNELFKKIQN